MTSASDVLDRLRWTDLTSDEPLYDALILLGPLVLLAIAALGRGPVTVLVAAGYVAAIVAAVGWKATGR